MKSLSISTIRKIGYFDRQNRYYLHDKYETDTSQCVRTPSYKWPFSIYRHAQTGKYYRSLSQYQLAAIAQM